MRNRGDYELGLPNVGAIQYRRDLRPRPESHSEAAMGPDSTHSAALADRLPATSGPRHQADRNVLFADSLDLELRLVIIHSQFKRLAAGLHDAHRDRRCVAIECPPRRRRVPVRSAADSLRGCLFDRYGSGVVTDGRWQVPSELAEAEPQG